MTGESEISSSTFGPGKAGDVAVEADALRLDFGFIETGTTNAGAGGNIKIKSRDARLIDGSGITADSSGSGPGGGVDILTKDLRLRDESSVIASSTGAGNAGGVAVTASHSICVLGGSFLATSADLADGGPIALRSGGNVTIGHDARVTTKADRRNAGDLTIRAPGVIRVDGGEVTTSAGGSGGNIVFDPDAIVLRGATVTANAIDKNAGNITLDSQNFLRDSSKVEASSERGIAGDITITAPEIDIAGGLSRLPGELGTTATLVEQCGLTLGGHVSSLVATSRGGAPPDPAGWSADVRLADKMK
jgi:hypothetical protein